MTTPIVGQTIRRVLLASTALAAGLASTTGTAVAQETGAEETEGDVVVVVGSQIAGAKPTEALAVTVLRQDEIDAIAATSGDDLFRSIPQLGAVEFNTTRTIGSINDARGDTASINLRALGTGNTLVLINGRRMVNHPGTQSENLVPVVTVNTNAIPVSGVSRVEVLLDGASAIYGSDAVAGVVNNVLKTDYEGFAAEIRAESEDGIESKEYSANFQWGLNFNDDRSNLSLFGSYLTRDPVFARERAFTAQADNSYRLPSDWQGETTAFRNDSATTPWGGFDRSPGTLVVDGVTVTGTDGEFHIQPDTLPGCLAALGNGLCIDNDSTVDAALRYNVNDEATVQSGVDRYNLFSFFNHEFDGGLQLFAEAGIYIADSELYRESAPQLGAVDVLVPASNYYNPFGPVGSPNRLPGYAGPAQGVDILLESYRPVDAGPRMIEVENIWTRVLGGLRGDVAGWDWESALLYTEANTTDMTNRVSNTAFLEALSRTTPDAYNPFNGGCLATPGTGDCTPTDAATIDDITVLVYRKDSTSLASWDAKVSRPDLFSMWAGDVGVAAGVEVRRETFEDDRDPRQDGSINYFDAPTNSETNDLQGNNPSLDTRGERDVQSAFVEFAIPLVSPENGIPLFQEVDLQLAARCEHYDTFGDVTKPKAALSWRPADFLLFRTAWSQGFRAPNLQQQFETGLQRSNNENDPVLGISYPVTSYRQDSLELTPEESENFSAGFVFEPTFLPASWGDISFTADYWEIEQTDVVGIFGADNHILLDFVLRQSGSFNPAVIRDVADPGQPAGEVLLVNDNYRNLEQREVKGVDLGFYYDLDGTSLGDFSFRINAAYLDTFFQDVSPQGQIINDAIADGLIPASFLVSGQGDLVKQEGRPEWRYSSSFTWRKGAFGAGWFTSFVGEVEDPAITRASDGAIWEIDSYQTQNAYVQYTHGDDTDTPTRFRFGVKNLTDEEPPLADTSFGYLGSIHSASGRSVYASVRKTF